MTIAIVDAGPLFSAIDQDEPAHQRAASVFTQSNLEFVIPTLVITEVAYFIGDRLGPGVEAAFIDSLDEFTIEPPTADDWVRIAQLIRQYRDFPLGTVDASVIALAERLNTDLIVTLDQRHFRAVRPRHVDAFRLVPD